MENIVGIWQTDVARSPGILEFFETRGLSREFCTPEKVGGVKICIVKDGDTYDYSMEIPGFPVRVNKYTPGQPFVFANPIGESFVTTIAEEDGKVIETMINTQTGEEMTTVREVRNDEMTAVCTYQDESYSTILVKVDTT